MKKTETLEIRFKSLDDFKSEVTTALSKKKKLVQPTHLILFESVTAFRSFMTIQKIEILTVIANREPGSIYELAKLVDRDFAAVLRDCVSLEGTSFIRLEEKKNGRESKMPVLMFPYSKIVIYLPSSPYQIDFKEVA